MDLRSLVERSCASCGDSYGPVISKIQGPTRNFCIQCYHYLIEDDPTPRKFIVERWYLHYLNIPEEEHKNFETELD
tara:strand:+ start:139 stop:366 length:228 start_codon:yes stop_codon:yes gene_type:complete